MRRLSVRLFVSHLAVALIGGLVAFGLTRLLAPRLYDEAARGLGLGRGQGQGRGPGQGNGLGQGPGGGRQARELVADAIDRSLLIGVIVGAIIAILLGLYLSWRLLAPLRQMQQATRRMADGDYRQEVARPGTTEFAELADDVNALAGALASTEARRVRLMSDVAHEMRTPLTVIDGYVEGMIDGVFPAEPARLGQISTEVRKLRRLTEDLSTLSRAEEGRLELDLAEVDLADVLRRTTERLRPQFDGAGVRLETTVTDGFPVRVDQDRIDQVVTNLLGNAMRATREQKSGETLLGIARGSVDGQPVARVTIVDNGVGLAPGELSKIFERFYRAPGAQKTDGTGIGLTIARDLVRAHGGELTASSPGPGHGASFTFTLPLV